jgi:hypothetical protein
MFYNFYTQFYFKIAFASICFFIQNKLQKNYFSILFIYYLYIQYFSEVLTLFEILMEIYSKKFTKRKFKFIDLYSFVLICLNLPLTLCLVYFIFHLQNLGNVKHTMNMLKQLLHPIEYVFASCTNLCIKH